MPLALKVRSPGDLAVGRESSQVDDVVHDVATLEDRAPVGQARIRRSLGQAAFTAASVPGIPGRRVRAGVTTDMRVGGRVRETAVHVAVSVDRRVRAASVDAGALARPE